MSHYKPYPVYRDSGVEWIGLVPEHWEVARIKRHASIRTERRSDVPADSPYIGLEDVEAESGQYKPTSGSARQTEDSTAGIFYKQDVLYGKLRPYLRKAIVAETGGACSTEFLILRTRNTLPRWLHQWLLTPGVTQQIESGCDGAKMPRADWEHVGSIEMPSPCPEEQSQIISSLDRETSRIDALIAKKTRFIELLKAKRQALITHAVTKGLDHNVKMRGSGVEWIGEVPEHWMAIKFNHVARVTEGLVDPKETPYRDMILIAPNHIESGTGKILGLETAVSQNAESGKYTCKTGAVIYSKIRPALAKVAIAPCDCLCSADMYPMDCTDRTYPEWLFYLMLSPPFTSWAILESDRVAMPKINRESLADLRVFLPPMDEQLTVVAWLRVQLEKLEVVSSKTQRSIDLLKERRAAFITAAVTGQIDLRESA